MSKFSITPNVSYVYEGDSVEFNSMVTDYNNIPLYWIINSLYGNVDASDIVGGTTEGTLTVTDGNISSFTLTFNTGTITGSEMFEVELRHTNKNGSILAISPSVTINELGTIPDHPSGNVEYTTPGIHTFTVPDNVEEITVVVQGPGMNGADGGVGHNAHSGRIYNGAGGGAGELRIETISTSPGTEYEIRVGQSDIPGCTSYFDYVESNCGLLGPYIRNDGYPGFGGDGDHAPLFIFSGLNIDLSKRAGGGVGGQGNREGLHNWLEIYGDWKNIDVGQPGRDASMPGAGGGGGGLHYNEEYGPGGKGGDGYVSVFWGNLYSNIASASGTSISATAGQPGNSWNIAHKIWSSLTDVSDLKLSVPSIVTPGETILISCMATGTRLLLDTDYNEWEWTIEWANVAVKTGITYVEDNSCSFSAYFTVPNVTPDEPNGITATIGYGENWYWDPYTISANCPVIITSLRDI